MKKPEVRQELFDIGVALFNNGNAKLGLRLTLLSEELRSRIPIRRAPTTANRVSTQIAALIRTYAQINPHASFLAIGVQFNVNPGRVSEILAGYRR